MTSELLFLTILIKIAFFLKRSMESRFNKSLSHAPLNVAKRGCYLHNVDCTLRVTGSHDAILAFANGDWDGMEDSAQPPVKVA